MGSASPVFGAATLAMLTILSIACVGKSDGLCIPSEREALLSFKRDLIDPTNQLSSWVELGDCYVWSGVLCHNSTGHVLELHLGLMGLVLGGSNTMNPSLLNLKHLTYLDFRGIDFKGIQIPGFLGSLENMRYLDLSQAQFGGMIPHQLGNLSNLQYLNLGSNSFPSFMSDSLKWVSNLFSLQYLNLAGADLSRATDWLQVTNTLPSLQELYLSQCNLNHTDPSPPALNNNISALSMLDLSFNSLDFPFSHPWISNLQGLTSLSLRSNKFGHGGSFPAGLQNSTSLRSLVLSWNGFTSSIPEWVFNFNQLQVLDLSWNSLQGRVPEGIQNLSSLTTLDLSSNRLIFGQFSELIDNSKFDLP